MISLASVDYVHNLMSSRCSNHATCGKMFGISIAAHIRFKSFSERFAINVREHLGVDREMARDVTLRRE